MVLAQRRGGRGQGAGVRARGCASLTLSSRRLLLLLLGGGTGAASGGGGTVNRDDDGAHDPTTGSRVGGSRLRGAAGGGPACATATPCSYRLWSLDPRAAAAARCRCAPATAVPAQQLPIERLQAGQRWNGVRSNICHRVIESTTTANGPRPLTRGQGTDERGSVSSALPRGMHTYHALRATQAEAAAAAAAKGEVVSAGSMVHHSGALCWRSCSHGHTTSCRNGTYAFNCVGVWACDFCVSLDGCCRRYRVAAWLTADVTGWQHTNLPQWKFRTMRLKRINRCHHHTEYPPLYQKPPSKSSPFLQHCVLRVAYVPPYWCCAGCKNQPTQHPSGRNGMLAQRCARSVATTATGHKTIF